MLLTPDILSCKHRGRNCCTIVWSKDGADYFDRGALTSGTTQPAKRLLLSSSEGT
jgi:hypothetical protein